MFAIPFVFVQNEYENAVLCTRSVHSEALLIYDFVKKIEIIHSEIVSFSPVSEGEKLGVGVWGEWGGGGLPRHHWCLQHQFEVAVFTLSYHIVGYTSI